MRPGLGLLPAMFYKIPDDRTGLIPLTLAIPEQAELEKDARTQMAEGHIYTLDGGNLQGYAD